MSTFYDYSPCLRMYRHPHLPYFLCKINQIMIIFIDHCQRVHHNNFYQGFLPTNFVTFSCFFDAYSHVFQSSEIFSLLYFEI